MERAFGPFFSSSVTGPCNITPKSSSENFVNLPRNDKFCQAWERGIQTFVAWQTFVKGIVNKIDVMLYALSKAGMRQAL